VKFAPDYRDSQGYILLSQLVEKEKYYHPTDDNVKALQGKALTLITT
jgi:hypothetical protein